MKTNFLNKLKQGLFLLIAVLGTFVGFSQSTQNPTIGGSKTPGTGGLLDIGGGKSSDGGLGQLRQFAGLTTKTQCNFVFLGDIGGGGKGTSSDTGQVINPHDVRTADIGFSIVGKPLEVNEIGGRGTDTGTGLLTIGGRSQEPMFGFALSDIGGRDSGGGYLPFGDIGGRGDVGTGLIFDTGGKTPGGIGFYEDGNQSKLSKIETYGCVLTPLYINE